MKIIISKNAPLYLLCFVMFAFFATGCSTNNNAKTISALSPDFFGIGDELARQLVENRRRSFGVEEKLIFTTVVNLDNLNHTTKFGRTLTESMATSLFQYGYGVVELRKSGAILIRDNAGELVLTRESKRLAKQHQAGAVVAGTYSVTPDSVIINIKLLDSVSQDVLSVAGLELGRSHTINYLLSDQIGMIDSKLSGSENF